jgi:hypothetical protein
MGPPLKFFAKVQFLSVLNFRQREDNDDLPREDEVWVGDLGVGGNQCIKADPEALRYVK